MSNPDSFLQFTLNSNNIIYLAIVRFACKSTRTLPPFDSAAVSFVYILLPLALPWASKPLSPSQVLSYRSLAPGCHAPARQRLVKRWRSCSKGQCTTVAHRRRWAPSKTSKGGSRRCRTQSDEDSAIVDHVIESQLRGFVGTTDAPCSGLVPELARLYPDAVIICTVRDPDAWVKSMATVANTSTLWFLRFVLFPLPALRYFVDYINVLRRQWVFLYGEQESVTNFFLERPYGIPQEECTTRAAGLFDVREGWEPLCNALNKDLPTCRSLASTMARPSITLLKSTSLEA